MKKIAMVMMVVGAMALAACGSSGSSSGGTAASQAEAAFNDFGNAVDACFDAAAQVAGGNEAAAKAEVSCTCPGGGTITADDDAGTMVIANCVSATGENYAGTFSSTDGGLTISGAMTDFGACGSGTATGVGTTTCVGALSVSCPAGSISCTITDDAGGEDECDLSCS